MESDKKIAGWKHGADGITYIIEHSDKNNYWFKTYWTPYIQDSIGEAIIVNNFIEDISNVLDLKENYKIFKAKIPHNGCYSNGGMAITCYQSNSYEIGYSGSTELPLGYTLGLNIGYIGNLKSDFGLSIIHQMDTHSDYDFSASIAKWNLFIRSKKGISDYVLYTYRQRRCDKIKDGTKFQNHNALYGMNLKSTSVAVGVDFLNGEKSKVGGAIFANQYISKPRLTLMGKSSFFQNQFDYRFEVSRYFNIKPLKGVFVGLYYENFAKYGNLGWSLSSYL